jgi:putative oxidoreductase
MLVVIGILVILIFAGGLFALTKLAENLQDSPVPSLGAIELFGGVALALGLFTRVAGLLLLVDMAAAIWKYNLNEGINAVQEYELPLILGLASLAVAATGGRQFTLDRLIRMRKKKA